MLQYRNHRFCWGQVSIEIPDGFYWNTDVDRALQIGVFLISPEKDYTLDILIYDDAASAYTELVDTVKDFEPLSLISEITINGFQGYQATYRTRTEQCYEAQLNIPGGTLSIVIKSNCRKISDIIKQVDLTAIVHDPREK